MKTDFRKEQLDGLNAKVAAGHPLTAEEEAHKVSLEKSLKDDETLGLIKGAPARDMSKAAPPPWPGGGDQHPPAFPPGMPGRGQEGEPRGPGTSEPVAQTVISGSGTVQDGRAAVLQLELNQLEQAIKYAGDHNEGSGLDVPAMKAKAQELRVMIATIKSQANPVPYGAGQGPNEHSTPLRGPV